MAISLSVFLIIYSLFLRKTTFFRFNRIFLLIGFIVSLIIPAIKYKYDIYISLPVTTGLTNLSDANNVVNQSAAFDLWSIFFVLYLCGVLLLLTRNIYVYRNLLKLINNGTKSKSQKFKLIENTAIESPFTFLNYILLNTKKLTIIEKDLILKHEITHINQKHWIDLLCSECMLLLQWFNPLAWLYVRLLKENHEYLADKAVIDSGISPAIYQAVLINQEFQGPVFSFSNSFNYLKPQNRLSMIKKAKSASWKRIMALLVVPMFGLFIWASAEPRYVLEYLAESVTTDTVPETKTYNIEITNDANTQGESTYYFRIGDNIDSTSVNTKGEKRVMVINSKKNDKKEIRSGTFVEGENIRWDDSLKGKPKIIIRGKSSDKKPLIILDGKEISDMKDISPEDIESVSILKDKSATEIYGDKGKDGVIIVTGKKSGTSNTGTSNATTVTNISNILVGKKAKDNTLSGKVNNFLNIPADKKPIIFVDGEKISEEINTIDTNIIESINIFKDKSATEKYGDEGKNGVILITTKKKSK